MDNSIFDCFYKFEMLPLKESNLSKLSASVIATNRTAHISEENIKELRKPPFLLV